MQDDGSSSAGFRRRRGSRPGVRRRDQDRRAERPVEPLRRPRGAGLGDRRAHGGRGFRCREKGHEGRGPLSRPPEQARCGLGHRPPVVRRRQGGRHLRRAELRRGAGREPDHPRQGQGAHRLGRGYCRPVGQGLLAEHGALDLRHLDARQRHRQRHRQDRRGHLVLPHRRLRLRPRARARYRGSGAEGRRQGPRQGAPPLEHPGLLLVPAAGAVLQGQDHRPGERRRRHHQLDQAGGRVRHRERRAEPGRAAGVHHRRPRAGAEQRAGPDPHGVLLLGLQRPDARLRQALRRGGPRHSSDDGPRRRVRGRAALPEGR